MKKIVWDVETTDLELAVRTYQLKNRIQYFDPKTIKRDWTMLGAAWQDLDAEYPSVISVSPSNPLDDEAVVRHLHSVLSDADVIIGHNSDNFDIKKFNTRAIYYGLTPLKPMTQIDTLKIARKYFKFTSNKLSYLCNYLGVVAKDESPDWEKCTLGDADELRYMREYNKNDVRSTLALYNVLMGWHHTHPVTAETPRDIEDRPVRVCHRCGSPNITKAGIAYRNNGIRKQRYQCKPCGGWQMGERI